MGFPTRLAALSCATSVLIASAFAQVSAYYITDGTSGVGRTHVWQAGSESFNYQWAAAGEMPIAIGNFGSGNRVRQAVGQPLSGNPEPGDEYLMNGTATGFQNLWNSGNPLVVTGYDATYDGRGSIYMVDWGGANDGSVYRYDSNYGNRTFMFKANHGDLGITYDSGTNTIWTANFNNGLVQQWSMTGVPLLSFTSLFGTAAALAFDEADQTLWMSDGQVSHWIINYDRNGNFIQQIITQKYLLGGEMVIAAPEPASLAALSLGAIILVRRRTRRAEVQSPPRTQSVVEKR